MALWVASSRHIWAPPGRKLSQSLTPSDLGICLLDRFIDPLDRALEKCGTRFVNPFVDVVRWEEPLLL